MKHPLRTIKCWINCIESVWQLFPTLSDIYKNKVLCICKKQSLIYRLPEFSIRLSLHSFITWKVIQCSLNEDNKNDKMNFPSLILRLSTTDWNMYIGYNLYFKQFVKHKYTLYKSDITSWSLSCQKMMWKHTPTLFSHFERKSACLRLAQNRVLWKWNQIKDTIILYYSQHFFLQR